VWPVESNGIEEEPENIPRPLTQEEEDIVDKEVIILAENIAEAVMEFIEEDEALAIEEEMGEADSLSGPDEQSAAAFARTSHGWKTNASLVLIVILQTFHSIL